MKIALDAMGGDFAPRETVKGAIEAVGQIFDLQVVLVGNKDKIENELKKYKYSDDKIEIVHTDEEILMKETMPPATAVRKKKNASMNIALRLVKDGSCHGAVSAGNTGALLTASQLTLKRIKGVLRPAITTVFPNKEGHMVMMDVGANAECKAEYINQFAIMGSEFSRIILERENPKVGLMNIGEEPGKGNELSKDAYELLKENTKINFIGNVETRDMFSEKEADVLVTDGFTGNMVLKTSEGVAKFMVEILKENIKISFIRKIGALLLKPVFDKLKDKLDSSAYGGAIFLGLNGVSIKAHGNSDARAIKNALRVAHKFAETEFVDKLKKAVQEEA